MERRCNVWTKNSTDGSGAICYPHSLNLRWARPNSDIEKVNYYNIDRLAWMSDIHTCLFLHKRNTKLIQLYPEITVPGLIQ